LLLLYAARVVEGLDESPTPNRRRGDSFLNPTALYLRKSRVSQENLPADSVSPLTRMKYFAALKGAHVILSLSPKAFTAGIGFLLFAVMVSLAPLAA